MNNQNQTGLQETQIDYDKIREQKTEMMRQFKESYDKALREGTITHRKI